MPVGSILHGFTTIFASPWHAAWFLFSLVMLAAFITMGLFGRNLFLIGVLIHGLIAIQALLTLTVGQADGEIISIHCVWFNAVMAFIHWRLLTAATRDKERDGSGDDEQGRGR